MIYRIFVQPTAKEDIVRNANWRVENHSIEQAMQWVDTIELQLQELTHHPERFGFAAENELFAYPLQQMLVGGGNRRSYRAVFTIMGDAVHVLTIRRAAQDGIVATDLPPTV